MSDSRRGWNLYILGVPGNGGAAQAVNAGALRTTALGLVPQILVEGVGASGNAVPLTADVGALLEGSGRGSRCNGAEESKGCKELHVEDIYIDNRIESVIKSIDQKRVIEGSTGLIFVWIVMFLKSEE